MQINKIYNESNLDTMARMPPEFVDLTVTSPPYDNLRKYNGYSFDFENVAKELYRVTKHGGVVVWVVSDQTIEGNETGTSFRQALYFKEIGFNLLDTMISVCPGTGAKGSILCYWQAFEYMFVFTKGSPKTTNRIADNLNRDYGKVRTISKKMREIGSRTDRPVPIKEFGVRTNFWFYGLGLNDRTEHPAPFPEQLAADHIYSWSNEGDLVYDPFMGSGTTAKMAHIQKRTWIGSEISTEYVKLAEKRIAPYLAQTTLF